MAWDILDLTYLFLAIIRDTGLCVLWHPLPLNNVPCIFQNMSRDTPGLPKTRSHPRIFDSKKNTNILQDIAYCSSAAKCALITLIRGSELFTPLLPSLYTK